MLNLTLNSRLTSQMTKFWTTTYGNSRVLAVHLHDTIARFNGGPDGIVSGPRIKE